MTTKHAILAFALIISQTWCWEALPQIPSGRRSQFLVLKADGGYKYGYDTGDGNAAKQSGDSTNQVSGHYFYKNAAGQNVDLKYTSGVQGFVPEGLEKLQSGALNPSVVVPSLPVVSQYSAGLSSQSGSQDDLAGTGDASYSFNLDTDTYKRTESSDARGNVQGSYSYSNEAGTHDLSYIAGENTGFVATSGSLARANGLTGSQLSRSSVGVPSTPLLPQSYTSGLGVASSAPLVNQVNGANGAYAFSYSAGDSSRQESADAGNNVQGRYSYQNAAGSHDLSYVAGAQTGFLVTGGSLSKPNGLAAGTPSTYSSLPQTSLNSGLVPVAALPRVGSSLPSSGSSTGPNPDGSYAFSYSAGDSERHEVADASGNVQGRYSYQNAAGSHDLSYVAGASTGFLPTGGSLSKPNGVAGGLSPSSYTAQPASSLGVSVLSQSSNSLDDGSDSQDDQANTGDSSYSFTVDTDEYKRVESADAAGNVRGSYSYKNNAGSHDLSYVAGSQTGFLPTGGSLSNPEVAAKLAGSPVVPSIPSVPLVPVASSGVVLARTGSLLDDGSSSLDDQANTGDSSYSFTVDTDEYKRVESSDAAGNVRGSYTYKNNAGSHGLDYVAGSSTGFLPTGGSLKVAPGLSELQLRSGASLGSSSRAYIPPLVHSSPLVQSYSAQSAVSGSGVLPATKTSVRLDQNTVVHSYLPPANEHGKFGYILETA